MPATQSHCRQREKVAELLFRVQSFDHRKEIFDRHLCLNIVDSVEHESAIFPEDTGVTLHFLAHLIWRTERQSGLRIHAAAPKHKLVAILLLQKFRIHPGC